MGTSRFLHPKSPGGLLSIVEGLLTANEALVVQAIEGGTYFHFGETPTGTIDGSNRTFTLSTNPNPDSSLEVYLNGQRLKLTEDYTLSGVILTMVIAPETDSILTVDYLVSPV